MKTWLEIDRLYESEPENTPALPWGRLKEITTQSWKRGPGNKVGFAKDMVKKLWI